MRRIAQVEYRKKLLIKRKLQPFGYPQQDETHHSFLQGAR